ncbi:uncharacterized protein I303_107125 [Kwoniella dejecticola CBS 10117]|uniref:Uncharacterized protein n=1 Tax=Kwoniella dejecticola CBS 10117 TaxID=1296121 RepID=A0A1A5ZYT3_9TREE|nr:uncharacterized protein I303_06527 [Kwoniella dejecticola CBS 10117]OBR82969.1 hypothetical protein I303_06527 [Kwoniella dejecticola CBS 10117]
MPTTLLSLSDETLITIANFLHGDNEIPLPSFNPHWANFVHEIDPAVQKDYLSFRSTCRRLNSLCPLKQLHKVFRKWSTVQRWKAKCPVSVMKAIKRIIIDIPLKAAPAPFQATTVEQKQQKDYDLWSSLSLFLGELTGLEELIIIQNPLCPFIGNKSIVGRCRLPSRDFLPSLRSLAFESRCRRCCLQFPIVLVPAAPNLQHLKGTITAVEGFGLPSISEAWLARHSPQTHMPIESIMLKNDMTLTFEQIIKSLHSFAPNLKHLHWCDYYKPNGNINPVLAHILGAKPANDEHDSWVFQEVDSYEDIFDDRLRQEKVEEEWEEDGSLETIDCLIEIIMPPLPTLSLPVCEGLTKSKYDSLHYDVTRSAGKSTNPMDTDRSAMIAAARLLVSKLPSLRKGFFWQGPQRAATFVIDGDFNFKRWTWSRDKDGESVTLLPWHEEFKANWTANTDGQE